MTGMNKVRLEARPPDGKLTLVCDCGATAPYRGEGLRFNRRHPAMCSERRQVSRELAAGVRCVDDEEGGTVTPKRVNARVGMV